MEDRTRPGKFVGLWHGGYGRAHGEWATDAEIFDTLDHAREVLRQRYHDQGTHPGTTPHVAEWTETPFGKRHFNYAVKGNKNHDHGYGLGSMSAQIILALRETTTLEDLEDETRSTGDPRRLRVLFGPRGGVRVETM